ncbi:MAG: hypothetical protein H0X28_00910 [Solirubrobacterales bacterium]|nr:hypothetical protein [Solirubrobacterales bacterium]
MPDDPSITPAVPPDPRSVDRDEALLADLTAPPPLEEVRKSFEYWTHRRATLPIYRRADRKEAEQMAARWKERLTVAEREKYGPGLLDQLLEALGVRWRPNRRRIIFGLSLLVILVVVVVVLIIAAFVLSPTLRELVLNSGGGGG